MRTERLGDILNRGFWLDMPDGYHYCLYVIRDTHQVLYVGRSDEPVHRIRAHVSDSKDLVGVHIKAHRPASLDWTVDLLTMRDTEVPILRSSRNFIFVVCNAERKLIIEHQPLFNSQRSKNAKW